MAKRTKSLKHVHRFMKMPVNVRNNRYIWRCTDADCTFFVYERQEHHVAGATNRCFNCEAHHRMDEVAMEMDTPYCLACREPEINSLDDYLNQKEDKPSELVTKFSMVK